MRGCEAPWVPARRYGAAEGTGAHPSWDCGDGAALSRPGARGRPPARPAALPAPENADGTSSRFD